MGNQRGIHSFVFVSFVVTALLAFALLTVPTGVAQDASPEASPSACVPGTPGAGGTPTAQASPSAAATPCPEGTPQAGGDSVEVESYDIYFEPKELSIPADTDVKVSLPNAGVTLHNFSIDALKISVDIDPGATEETTINAPAGTYEYYCNVPGHKAAGMVGTLTVK